jgi:hypothetical protein
VFFARAKKLFPHNLTTFYRSQLAQVLGKRPFAGYLRIKPIAWQSKMASGKIRKQTGYERGVSNSKKEGTIMKQKKSALSTIALAGTLALGLSPVWAQNSSTGTNSGSQMKSSQSHNRPAPHVGEQRNTQAESRSSEAWSNQPDQATSSGRWQREDIKKVQEALKNKGNDPGPVDGILGPQTKKALRNFQQSQGLKATGRLDAKTAKALGIQNGAREMESSQSHNRPTPHVGEQRNTQAGSRSSGPPFSSQSESSSQK